MKAFPVAVLCRVMNVSRSGFYEFLIREASKPCVQQVELEYKILEIFKKSKSCYGSRRIRDELIAQGIKIGRFKTRSMMKKLGLRVKTTKKYRVTTSSNHKHPVAQNILDREFYPAAANKIWATDITYIWTLEGWSYLAIVMDLYSRRIVGWNIGSRMTKNLVLSALDMAFWQRKPAHGLIHHSDRGSQYACKKYQERLELYKMTPSMSRKGNCWDNAPVERFFRSLKSERISYCRFETRAQARMEVLDYITWYNSDRLHSTLGGVSPATFEMPTLRRVA